MPSSDSLRRGQPSRVTEVGESWFGFSLRSLLLIVLGILLFGLYVGVLLFGENSLEVLNGLKREKRQLLSEKHRLQSENQRLQKQYFELLQITGE
jgi:cell division protein FtsL